jgi:hypothetical protein
LLRIGTNSNENTWSVSLVLPRWWKTQLAATCLISTNKNMSQYSLNIYS